MLTCRQVADYFLAQQEEESGDLMSNLKLQKLMYYAQGLSLAARNKPLFNESIEAWMHGPVVPELYHAFKRHGADAIPAPTDFDLSAYDAEEKEILDEVYKVFGQFSGWKLRNMTHDEPPWKNTPSQEVISHASMTEYFKTQIIEE
jgi:uncharacterized phage-associated protein